MLSETKFLPKKNNFLFNEGSFGSQDISWHSRNIKHIWNLKPTQYYISCHRRLRFAALPLTSLTKNKIKRSVHLPNFTLRACIPSQNCSQRIPRFCRQTGDQTARVPHVYDFTRLLDNIWV